MARKQVPKNPKAAAPRQGFPIVGIGASAGGLEAQEGANRRVDVEDLHIRPPAPGRHPAPPDDQASHHVGILGREAVHARMAGRPLRQRFRARRLLGIERQLHHWAMIPAMFRSDAGR